MAFMLWELGLSELILRTFLIFIHRSSAVSRTLSGTLFGFDDDDYVVL